jgi:tRNA threonylcarbamoyl adenosine modification protein YeaZ
MLILGINTAFKKVNIVFFDEKKVLAELSFDENNNGSEIFLENIKKLLEKISKDKKDLEGIFVISGPGSYTALRVGIVVANALAFSLNIPIYGLNIFEFLKLTNAFDLFDWLAINSGKDELYFLNKVKISEKSKIYFDDLLKFDFSNTKIVASLSEKQEKKFKFAQIDFPFSELLLRLDFKKLKADRQINAEYFKEAV